MVMTLWLFYGKILKTQGQIISPQKQSFYLVGNEMWTVSRFDTEAMNQG